MHPARDDARPARPGEGGPRGAGNRALRCRLDRARPSEAWKESKSTLQAWDQHHHDAVGAVLRPLGQTVRRGHLPRRDPVQGQAQGRPERLDELSCHLHGAPALREEAGPARRVQPGPRRVDGDDGRTLDTQRRSPLPVSQRKELRADRAPGRWKHEQPLLLQRRPRAGGSPRASRGRIVRERFEPAEACSPSAGVRYSARPRPCARPTARSPPSPSPSACSWPPWR